MSKVSFDVRYSLGHSSPEAWEKIDLFCPHCGKQDIWQEQSSGDYYVGENYLCEACAHSFTIQGPSENKHEYGETCWKQRLAAIRKATP